MTATQRTVVALFVAVGLALSSSVAFTQPTGYCETDCGPSTACDYQCMYGGSFTTCDAYNGDCEPGCGDGICSSGEDGDNCEVDCVVFENAEADVYWPANSPAWSAYSNNWPDEDEVGGCYGNCGPGCSRWSVCGGPSHYWELELLSSPSVSSYSTCFCVDNYNQMECGDFTTYTATGEWTYYGYKANGCFNHDTSCRTGWWSNLVFAAIGYLVAPSYTAKELFTLALMSHWGQCLVTLPTFAAGGGCSGAASDTWSYVTTLYADEYSFSHYDYGSPGSCYVGPPFCGDGVCQTSTCMYGGSGTEYPGSGCEELGGFNAEFCSADCS